MSPEQLVADRALNKAIVAANRRRDAATMRLQETHARKTREIEAEFQRAKASAREEYDAAQYRAFGM